MVLNSSGRHRAERRFAEHLMRRRTGPFGKAFLQTPLRRRLLTRGGLLAWLLSIHRRHRLRGVCLSFRALVLHEGIKLSICKAHQQSFHISRLLLVSPS